jgi:hypothetical protein
VDENYEGGIRMRGITIVSTESEMRVARAPVNLSRAFCVFTFDTVAIYSADQLTTPATIRLTSNMTAKPVFSCKNTL